MCDVGALQTQLLLMDEDGREKMLSTRFFPLFIFSLSRQGVYVLYVRRRKRYVEQIGSRIRREGGKFATSERFMNVTKALVSRLWRKI